MGGGMVTPLEERLTTRDRLAIGAGLIGTTTIALGAIVTALGYEGTHGQRYSPLNHWVSELGEIGVSDLAPVFNGALVIGGACFVVFMIGLAAARRGWLPLVYGGLGVVAGVAGMGVGIFPMNELDMHGLVALTFFNLGWIVVGIASLHFVAAPDRRFPRWLALVGAATVAAFIGFLASLQAEGLVGEDALGPPAVRPDAWIVPTLEWALIVGILAWVFLTAFAWWRASRPGEPG